MDELAEKIGLDPVTLRIQNDAKVDPITGKRFSSRHLTECLQRGAALFGWKARVAMPGSMRLADGTRIGYRVAAGANPGYIAPALAKVRLNSDGHVDVSVGGHEMGQGIRTAIAVVLAEELGIDPQTATIAIGDPSFHHSTLRQPQPEPRPLRCRSAMRRSACATRWRCLRQRPRGLNSLTSTQRI